MKKIISFFILLFLIVTIYTQFYKKEPHINLLFRYDDYSSISNLNVDKKLFEIFKDNNITLTVGVIPYAFTGEVRNPNEKGKNIPLNIKRFKILDFYLQTHSIEVSLHGETHQNNGLGKSSSYETRSEFKFLNFNKQYKKLNHGISLLNKYLDVETQIFIPPFNAYDINTLKAMNRVGLKTISANNFCYTVDENSIQNYLPITYNLETIEKLNQKIKDLEKSIVEDSTMVIMLHPFTFKEFNSTKYKGEISLKEFNKTLSSLNKHITIWSFSKYIKKHNVSAKRQNFNAKIFGWYNALVPQFVQSIFEPPLPIYYDISLFSLLSVFFQVVLLYIFIFFLVFIMYKNFLYKLKNIYFVNNIFSISLFLLLLSILFFKLYQHPNPIKMISIDILIALLVSSIYIINKKRISNVSK